MIHPRSVLLPALALLPITAVADISWYFGAGAGGTRLEEDINGSASALEWNGTAFVPLIDLTGSSNPAFGDYNPRFGQAVEETLDKFEGTDVGFRVFGGVRIGQYFGIEVGYVDLGEPEDQLSIIVPRNSPFCQGTSTNPCRPETDAEIVFTDEIDGFEAFLLGAFPFAERWEAFAKIGVIMWDSDLRVRNNFNDTFPPTTYPPEAPIDARIPLIQGPPFSTASDDGTDLAGGFGVNYKVTERMSLRGEGTWYDIDNIEQAWMLGFNVIVTY
jgi:opacity protein-like surface antigen